MATQVQRRRGTTTEHASFTGAEGELTVDTTKDTVVVHDGATAGGQPLAREDLDNVSSTDVTAKVAAGTTSAAGKVQLEDSTTSTSTTTAATPNSVKVAKDAADAAQTTADAALPAAGGTITNDLTIEGDLTVNGTTTTIDTETLVVKDKNIEMGVVDTPTDTTADGGGITLKGATDKTINWIDATDAWTSSERFSVPLGSAASPSLTFTGDENTGIYSPGADQVAVATNGIGRLFIDNAGRILVGTDTSRPSAFGNASSNLNFQLEGEGVAGAAFTRFTTGSTPPSLHLQRARGTQASPTIVNSGDLTGYLLFSGYDGDRFINTGNIEGGVSGTPANDTIGGYLAFKTNPGVEANDVPQERLRITSAGLVGIGTSVPSTDLEISNDSGSAITLDAFSILGGELIGAINFRNRTNVPSDEILAYIKAETGTAGRRAGTLSLGTGNSADATTRLFIGNTGKVGINTTTPAANLEVVGSSTGEIELARFRIEGQTNNPMLRIFADEANKLLTIGTSGSTAGSELRFSTKASTTESARIDSSGRLLVGTSSSQTAASYTGLALQVHGAGASSGGASRLGSVRWSNNDGPAGIVIAKSRSETPGTYTIVEDDDKIGRIDFAADDGTDLNTIAARIDAEVDGTPGANEMPGRLVFSTRAPGPSAPTEGLRIDASQVVWLSNAFVSAASFATTGKVRISNAAGTNTGSVGMESYGSTTATRHHISFSNPNGVVGSISTNASATAYNTSSDYRLKENVTPVSDGITRLQQLKPSRFNFIADPDTVVDGFLAHEVQTIVPEAITGEKDAVDDDGNPEYQGIDQSKLVPLLTAALQEAIAKIETLQGMVAVNNITIDEQQHQISALADRLIALETQ